VTAIDAHGTGLPPAPAEKRSLSDAGAVALAGLTWAGATASAPVPVTIGAGVVVLAAALRRPFLLCVGALLLASALGARAADGMAPARAAAYDGTVTLVSDPVDRFGSSTADVRLGGRRLELQAASSGRGELRGRLAGERVAVRGRIRPPPAFASWLRTRHVVGRLEAGSVEPAGAGSPPWRAANRLRRLLVAGADSLPPDRRALFTGFLLGDDRDQSDAVADDFRGAGLTHLLAVSGENVAFVLVLVGPLLRRLTLRPRWIATVGVVAFFSVVTRFEPSVLRAATMAALAATAFALGRPASGLRLLALAVAGLVLVDPFLVGSVGFRLSVAASAGILVVAPVLRRRVPGPGWLVDPLAVTVGAQLAVSPLLVTTFGGMPVASLPANLAAGPAAGLVMTWGMGAGIPAGLVGGNVARLLHIPTSVLIGWVAGVARVGADAPLGEVRGPHLLALLAGAGLLVATNRRRRRVLHGAALVVIGGALLAPALTLRAPPNGRTPLGPAADLWRSGGATVVVAGGDARPGDLLEGARRAGVRRIDLLVLTGGGPGSARAAEALAHRAGVVRVWAPAGHQVRGATTPNHGEGVRIGGLVVTAGRTRPALAVGVTVASPSAPRARAPPLRRDHPSGRARDLEPHP